MNAGAPLPIPTSGARVLPWSLEAEQAVLGGILLHPDSFAIVRPIVTERDFYHPAHRAIFAAMVDLGTDRPIDAITVAEQMRANDTAHKLRALGQGYFADLTSAVITIENVDHYAKIIRLKAARRRVIETAQAIAVEGYADDGDDAEFVANAEAQLATVARTSRSNDIGYRPIRVVLGEVIRETEEAADRLARGAPPIAIPTGFAQLDRLIYGWEPGTSNIVAARPSVGKTAFMMDVVEAAAMAGSPCFVGTREMRDRALIRRRISAASGVDHGNIRRGALAADEWAAVMRGSGQLSKLPIAVTKPFVTFEDFEGLVRLWRARDTDSNLVGLASLDYLQLLRLARVSKTWNREQEVSEMSRRCKSIAQELNLAALVLCQLNRASEKEQRRPRLSDLRDSGGIEQDADVLMFLHRKTLTTPTTALIVGKQRNGALDDVPLYFDGARVRFLEPAPGLPMPHDGGEDDEP